MTRHSSLAGARRTLLNSLGLPPDASDEELAARREELHGSLDTAPQARRKWIEQQLARIDAVTALDAAGEVAEVDDGADEPGADAEGPGTGDAAAGEEPDPDDPVALDEIDEASETRRRAARRTGRRAPVTGADVDDSPVPSARQQRTRTAAAQQRTGASPRQRSDATAWVARIVIVALVVAVVLAVYKLGAPSGSSGSDASSAMMDASASATPTLDAAQVSELEQKVRDDPQDTDSMGRLASLYARAGDYANASKWQARVVELKPDDVEAQLTLGVSCFNNNDLDCAKEHWDIVNTLDPNNAELHFDLGYYYLSIDPPDIDKVKQEWNRYLELEPNGEYAETVRTHMGSLDETGTPTPSASSTP